MSQEQSMVIVEPKTPTMKRRRGRPSSNKKPSSVLGESFFSIKKTNTQDDRQEPDENETAKVSEAALRKGFNSTPVMKLSPMKNVKKNKSVLLDLSNNKTHNNSTTITMKVQTESPVNKDNSSNRIFETPDRKNKSFDTCQNSNFLSSSPMTNIMSSEINNRDSSPLQTSPLPSATANNVKFVQNTLQSSPWTGYEDQFNKYINSSPICVSNTPKRTDRTDRTDRIDRSYRTDRVERGERISKVQKTTNVKVVDRIDLSRYRFNYQYKITLDINEQGVAQLYARVLELNNMVPHYGSENKGWLMNRRLAGFEIPMNDTRGENSYRAEFSNNNELDDCINFAFEQGIYQEGIVPSRFEQYIENCKRYNQEREEMIQNCMKNDVFFTAPMRYPQSIFNSPKQERTVRNFHSPLDYHTKTVNINHIISNNKGISAGVQHEYRNKLYTSETNSPEDDIELNMKPIVCRPNDALSALREVVLSSPETQPDA